MVLTLTLQCHSRSNLMVEFLFDSRCLISYSGLITSRRYLNESGYELSRSLIVKCNFAGDFLLVSNNTHMSRFSGYRHLGNLLPSGQNYDATDENWVTSAWVRRKATTVKLSRAHVKSSCAHVNSFQILFSGYRHLGNLRRKSLTIWPKISRQPTKNWVTSS